MEVLHASHLYQVIQSFLKGKDYLALMNCNHVMFDDIKRETIQFYKSVKDVDEVAMIQLLAAIGEISQRIETPSQQITLQIQTIAPQVMPSIRFMSHYLRKLSVETHWELNSSSLGPVFKDVDFTIFNNIPVVELIGFPEVTKISKGLQNIRHLSLNIPDLIEIYDLNCSNCLKSLTIKPRKLNIFPVRTNFAEEFKIITQEEDVWKRHYSHYYPFTISFVFRDRERFLYLSELSLSGNFLNTQLPIERFIVIEKLLLNHTIRTTQPEFPYGFNGKNLFLHNFNLSKWPATGLSLPNIQNLHLIRCSAPKSLPEMPNLQELKLNTVSNIQAIRTYPRCTNLHLNLINSITSIGRQPKLRHLSLNKCNTFAHFFEDNEFVSLSVIQPLSPMDLYWARNSKALCLYELHYSPSFGGFELPKIPPNEREYSINFFENMNLTPLSNIKRLVLINSDTFGSVTDSTQLSNIGEIDIRKCSNYVSTCNLLHVRERLCINNCASLQKLVNLQGIPEIALSCLINVDDFSGLGDNDHVYVCNVPYLIKCAKKYRRVRYDSHLKAELPYAAIFDSIKAFTVILAEGEQFREEADDDDEAENNQQELHFPLYWHWQEIHKYNSFRLW